MILYFTPSACSLAPRIILNELGVKFEEKKVDLKEKKTADGANFLDINPKGAVPTLKINDHEILTENAAILQYLADSNNASQLLPKVGDIKRYHVIEFLNFVATEMHKSIGMLFNPNMTENIKQNLLLPLINKKFEFLNKHFKTNKYLLGDEFTLPDAYLFVILRWAYYFKLDLSSYENLVNYFEMMSTRQSVKKSLAEEGL